jgi:hypothetical protein
MFQIFAKTLSGKTITIDVSNNISILELKKKIYQKEGIPVEYQSLSYSSKTLGDNSKLISDYNISKENTINIGIKFTKKN